MDIHQEKWDYTAMLVAEDAITQEQCDTLKLSDGINMFYSDHLASTTIDCINWGWSSWLKAKTQAVPNGFVLVPKELTHEQAVKISDHPEFFETYQTILTESDTSEDSAVILIQTAHKAMIEAQEPTND